MAAFSLSSRLGRLAATLGAGAIATALFAGPAAASAQHAAKPKPAAPGNTATVADPEFVPKPAHTGQQAVRPMTAWSIYMTASSTRPWGTQSVTFTATTNTDVGPTPYYIVIWQDNSILARCGTGTTCSVSASFPTPQTHGYEAAIERYDGSDTQVFYPDTGGFTSCGGQAICVEWHGVSFTTSVGYATLPLNGVTTVTATASEDVGPSPFFIDIFDTTTGTLVGSPCGYGTTCSATVSQSAAATHKYVAYLADPDSTYLPGRVQSTSSPSWVTWAPGGWQLSLSGPTLTTAFAQLTVTANENLSGTPYSIEVFDDNTGTLKGSCNSGTTCTLNVNPDQWGDNKFVAFVSSAGSAFPPAGIQASSNVIDVTINVPIH